MYEDYMQNLLGYRMNPYQNTYDPYNGMSYIPRNEYGCMDVNCMEQDLEDYYPEIYKIIYPMIQKACMRNTEPITDENIERMVEDIYSNIEAESIINLDVNIGNAANMRTEPNRNTNEKVQDRGPGNNFLLRDLIRILLIRELLGRPGGPGPRPGHRPPRPPRPPFPPRPPMPRY